MNIELVIVTSRHRKAFLNVILINNFYRVKVFWNRFRMCFNQQYYKRNFKI